MRMILTVIAVDVDVDVNEHRCEIHCVVVRLSRRFKRSHVVEMRMM